MKVSELLGAYKEYEKAVQRNREQFDPMLLSSFDRPQMTPQQYAGKLIHTHGGLEGALKVMLRTAMETELDEMKRSTAVELLLAEEDY